MQIDERWAFEDKVSGLRFSVCHGKKLDRLHIEVIGEPIVRNRDLYFDKEGQFDGTGSCVGG